MWEWIGMRNVEGKKLENINRYRVTSTRPVPIIVVTESSFQLNPFTKRATSKMIKIDTWKTISATEMRWSLWTVHNPFPGGSICFMEVEYISWKRNLFHGVEDYRWPITGLWVKTSWYVWDMGMVSLGNNTASCGNWYASMGSKSSGLIAMKTFIPNKLFCRSWYIMNSAICI